MDFATYQSSAQKTQVGIGGEDAALALPLLGLAGEAGELLSEYKKYLRDGPSHTLFRERIAEELGDVLWYVASIASTFGLDLEEVAKSNLVKCRERWGGLPNRKRFDDAFPTNERLPDAFVAEFRTVDAHPFPARVLIFVDGQGFGDELTDNAHTPDGYGYHDVLHFAFAAVLGWSPLLRKMLKAKRKSIAMMDEVEDGARAVVTEEAVSAAIFAYSREYNFLEGKSSVSADLLKTLKNIVSHLEVGACTTGEWERAILQGMKAWRGIRDHKGGFVDCDLANRTIDFRTQ